MNKLAFSLVTLFFLLTINSLKAQNSGTCTHSINYNDTSTIVLTSGQTFCVDSMGIFNGKISLNGGSICVKGMFNPSVFVFNSGTINNYGNMTLNISTMSLNSGSMLNNNQDAMINLKGTLNLSGGTFTNNGILNIDQVLNANNGVISNSSTINCTTVNGINNITNTGNINSN